MIKNRVFFLRHLQLFVMFFLLFSLEAFSTKNSDEENDLPRELSGQKQTEKFSKEYLEERFEANRAEMKKSNERVKKCLNLVVNKKKSHRKNRLTTKKR